MKERKARRKSSVAEETVKSSRSNEKVYNDQVGMHDFKLTDSQKACQNEIRNNTLVFLEGPAGTGKSLAVLHYFSQLYLRDRTKQIVVIRTPVESAGKDKVGYLPNDLSAKIEPHFASTKKILGDLINPSKVEADMDKRIIFKIPNYILGATLDNSLIMIDEAQMLEPLIMKLLLERIGQDSICVVVGDRSQVYNTDGTRNGLKDAVSKFFYTSDVKNDTGKTSTLVGVPKYNDIGYYKFTADDVQRSAIVKTVVRAYSE